MHTNHEPIETHGLADNCPHCDLIAEQPFIWLSDTVLGALIDREEQGKDPRSHNEWRAMNLVYNAQERLRRLESREYQAASEDWDREGADDSTARSLTAGLLAEGKRVLGND